MVADVLNDLDENLLHRDLPPGERRAIHRMVVTALECRMRGLPPPGDDVKFWVLLLEPGVFLPTDCGTQ